MVRLLLKTQRVKSRRNPIHLEIQITLSLLAGGGQSLEVGSTSLGNISGLFRDEGSVGVGGEWGGDGGNSQVVTEPGVDVGGGSQTGDKVDRCLCFTLLPAGLSNGGKMSLTGLNNISGLGRHKGTVRVSSEGGGDGGNSKMVAEEAAKVGGDNMGGSHTGDEVDGNLSFALLPSGLSNGSEVGGTGLNNISGLGRHEGTVGMSSEGSNNGGNVTEETKVGGVCVAGDQVDGELGLALLTSVHSGTGGVHVGGTNKRGVASGALGRVVVGGDGGTIGVGDQVGGGVKHLCLPLAVVVDGVDKARSVDSEGVDQLASLSGGLQMGGGRGGVVWVVRGNGAIGVMHQLGRGTSNKERADYQELHDAQSSENSPCTL